MKDIIHALGKDWYSHTPGEPWMGNQEEKVTVLYDDPITEFTGRCIPARCFNWRNTDGLTPIIGWRPETDLPTLPPTQPQAKGEFECLICTKPVADYEPQFCCSGHECGCMGQPIEPCVCSPECSDAVFDYIGIPMEERRVKAGIPLWSEAQKETLTLKAHSWSDTSLYSDATGKQICTHSIYSDATEETQDEMENLQARNMQRLCDCWNLLAGHDLTKVAVVDRELLSQIERWFGQALRQWNHLYDETNFEDDEDLEDAKHEEGNFYRLALKAHQSLAKLNVGESK